VVCLVLPPPPRRRGRLEGWRIFRPWWIRVVVRPHRRWSPFVMCVIASSGSQVLWLGVLRSIPPL
jgi:hypothetical protein